jgi:hypothetical protein
LRCFDEAGAIGHAVHTRLFVYTDDMYMLDHRVLYMKWLWLSHSMRGRKRNGKTKPYWVIEARHGQHLNANQK